MTQGIALIAGLGNPGDGYSETRHNAGFRFLDVCAQRFGATFKSEKRFSGDIARVTIAGRDIWLIKPMTFMNLSGDGVSALARFHKIEPHQILVAHDELDIPPGTARLKIGGGHGGHNGLRDIVDKLGSREFLRLRLGIGHPGSAHMVSSYVLKKAPSAEQMLTDAAINAAADEIETIVRGDYEQVMNRLHTHAVQ